MEAAGCLFYPVTTGRISRMIKFIASCPENWIPVLIKAAAGGGGKGMRRLISR
ncbi:MAG: hypothetical protein IPP67_02965 [Rhodospirillaceae bacterium]|nr:hypothetical protein [Rhodospirillaceae bacterium]